MTGLRLILLACSALSLGAASKPTADILFKDALVVDGTGHSPYRADVAVRGDVIVAIGPHFRIDAKTVVDAKGRALTPGFIDSHAHGDPLRDPFVNDISQGVTLAVLGQDGRTPGASEEGGESKGMSYRAWASAVNGHGSEVNVAALTGFGTLREASGAGSREHVTPEEQARMRRALQADLDAGSFGMSSGLEYVPDRYSSTEELVDLARVVGRNGGVIESHMRSEDDDKIEGAIGELLAQGRFARVHISHLKVVIGHGAARGRKIEAEIAAANRGGIKLSADVYPYTAGFADFGLDYPSWAQRREDFEAARKSRRKELAQAIHARVLSRNGPSAITIESGPDIGLTLEEAARKAGKPFEDYIIDAGYSGPAAAHTVQDADLQDVFVASPWVAISSDGAPEMRHPRSWGAFAKVIEEYVVHRRALTLAAAVRKMSGYPASILGLRDRGCVAVGCKADLVLFDPGAVHVHSTWTDPFKPATGIDLVLVNGTTVWRDGRATGAKPGRVLVRERKGS